MTLQDLLNMKAKTNAGVEFTPDFRIAVQQGASTFPHIIVHAMNYDSETLDFYVSGNELIPVRSDLQNTLSAA